MLASQGMTVARLLQLKQAADIPFPFTLSLKKTQGEFVIAEELRRFLPHKRLACKASYQGQAVFIKIFFGKGYKQRAKREFDGVQLMSKAGVPTPKVIDFILNESSNFSLVIFQFIDQAETLGQKLAGLNSAEKREAVFRTALAFICKMHDQGCYQQDVHLDNFLDDGNELYLIDGDQVNAEQQGSGLSEKWAIRNLAMFLTQLPQWEKSSINQLLDSYIQLRDTSLSANFRQAVLRQLSAYRDWREEKYINKKVFRRCTAFDVIKDLKQYCVFSRALDKKDVEQFIANPDSFINAGQVLKSGRSATVAKVEIAGKCYLVKRYNKKNTLHQLARSVMESRAAVSWRNGHLLDFNGVETAKPLMLLENRFGKLRGRSYVVTEYLEGMHAYKYFQSAVCRADAIMMAEKIHHLIQHLHACGYAHGDLKAHNIWISQNNPILIDLDGMKKAKLGLMDKDWSRLQKDLGTSDIAEALFK